MNTYIGCALGISLMLSPVLAQRVPANRQVPEFRAGIDVVALSVTAIDSNHGYVTDLERDDFLVLEDGQPQQVTYFRQSGVSLAIALLLDTSASMSASLQTAQNAAVGFVRALKTADLASVICFNSRVEVRQNFTTDHDTLERAIRQIAVGGTTSLHNAILVALQELKKTIGAESVTDPRRRAMVVLSDGDDTSSLMGFDEVLDVAERSDTAVYAIGLFGTGPRTIGTAAHDAAFRLRRLAERTGGRAFFPVAAKELDPIYREIRADLSNQYVLAYESTNARRDGQFRHIAVRVNRPGVVARTRPGYFAPRQ